jgi:hypothetical protein
MRANAEVSIAPMFGRRPPESARSVERREANQRRRAGAGTAACNRPHGMADRRSFLGAVSGAAAAVLLAPPADAQAPAPQAPPASPLPSPKPSASPKPASAAAAAIAASMRRFDPALADGDLDTIAHAIDDNRRATTRLNPRKATGLKNADEPVTRFAVPRPR